MRHFLTPIAALCATTLLCSQNTAFVAAPEIPGPGTLVFDPDRGQSVLFESLTQRMWEWDGTRFRVLLGATHSLTSAIWDPIHHQILAYDGALWDGANWGNLTAPNGWSLGAMAFDEARQRLVRRFGSGSQDIAEWDGTSWHRINPPASPGSGSLVYDAGRGACVLGAGNPLTLWTWDGSQWNLLDANGPSGSFALVFDPGHNRLVANGTNSPSTTPLTYEFTTAGWSQIAAPAAFSSGSTALAYDGIGLLRLGAPQQADGFWRLEGNLWNRLSIEQPLFRTDAALASAPTATGILLFGGNATGNVLLDDTWVHDTGWVKKQPAHSPSPRRRSSLAWSPTNNAFLLYGGTGAQNTILTDTWLWNGTDWLQQNPATSPGIALQVVTDPAGGVLGLRRTAIGTTNDQWQWNGTTWINAPSHGAIYAGAFVVAGYDWHRNVVTAGVEYELWEWDGLSWSAPAYLAGSSYPSTAVYRPETQRMMFVGNSAVEWDGSNWTTLNLGSQPFATEPMLATDFATGRVFSLQHNRSPYGSWNGVSAVLTSTPATAQRFGFGCGIGRSPGLLTDGRPTAGDADFAILGTTFAANAPCVVALGLTSQGLHLGGGCVSWISQPPAVHFVLSDAAGRARLPLAIPSDLSLRGTTILTQLAAFDPAHSPLGSFTVSDGLQFTIGD